MENSPLVFFAGAREKTHPADPFVCNTGYAAAAVLFTRASDAASPFNGFSDYFGWSHTSDDCESRASGKTRFHVEAEEMMMM